MQKNNKRIGVVAGARPNFIKIAPILKAMDAAAAEGVPLGYRLIHTGQHYDRLMSDAFFKDLGIPDPDAFLGCGGGTQAEQTAAIMVAFEKELLAHPVDLVLVVGDVTSTMACTIVAKKLHIPVAHVEAGIRSGDETMPEEINRMVTDSICDWFFTTSRLAGANLERSGVAPHRIFFVGNVMIDTLLQQMPNLRQPQFWDSLQLEPRRYLVLTLHRPANVDDRERLRLLLNKIIGLANGRPVVFPVHPRTAQILKDISLEAPNLHLVSPQGYLHFNYLVRESLAVVTDSGGITEEATVMGIPCITLRNTTERPETVTTGTNELVGDDFDRLGHCFEKLYAGQWKKGGIPENWDGQSAGRIVRILAGKLCHHQSVSPASQAPAFSLHQA